MAYAGFDKINNVITFGFPLQCASGSSNLPSISFTQNKGVGVYLANSNSIGIVTSNLENFRFTSDGKLGIGTTTPSSGIDLYASNAVSSLNVVQTGTGSLLTCSNSLSNGVIITNNGNIGINTFNPRYGLHINGTNNIPNLLGYPSCSIYEERANTNNNSPVTVGLSAILPGWFTRIFNTNVIDTIGLVINGDNTFTIPVGTYLIQAEAIANSCGKHKIALYNSTTSTYVTYGTTEYSQYSGSIYISTKSTITYILNITGSTTFSIRHWIETKSPNEPVPNGVTFGYSSATSSSTTSGPKETYARMSIIKYQ